MPLSPAELSDLRFARDMLENPSLAARLAEVLGYPVEQGMKLLPVRWSALVDRAVDEALHQGLVVAVKSLGNREGRPPANWLHKVSVAATGAAGGALGLPALAVELPISTALMLRSIADIARSEGESIESIEGRLACLEVFALGGRSEKDDAAETGYYAVRALLGRSVSEAARYLAGKGSLDRAAPPLVRLLAKISSRFGVNVSQKMAAQAVPVIGAAGGALVNAIFIDHFQEMARGHFIVRRLERTHGRAVVQEAYEQLPPD